MLLFGKLEQITEAKTVTKGYITLSKPLINIGVD